MPASKIVDESEVLRWFEEGRTYQWMTDQYREKYGIETVQSLWGNFRRRRGLDKRAVHDDDLIPWEVKPEHRFAPTVNKLRTEGRRRAGHELSEYMEKRLDGWLRGLERDGVVVHYDPDTEQGWFYVPRERKDKDIVRMPARKTTKGAQNRARESREAASA